jgi:prepilin-type N-terminal cleavage/methylation domain-containing protein
MSHTEGCQAQRGGFTLIELLVAMIAVMTMMIGVAKLFVLQHRSHARQELSVMTEENLRLASSMITDALRNAGYAAPSGNPSSWMTWVSPSLTANPLYTSSGSATVSDSISVAACFNRPVGTLSAAATKDVDTTLSVTPTSGNLTDALDTNSKKLIRIGESEFAWVTAVSSNSITVDTNTVTGGNQPVRVNHPIGANICRVDAITFSIANSQLMRNDNQGSGAQAVADNISLMKITFTAPKTYVITLTGTPSVADPVSGSTSALTRTLSTTVTLRN